MIAIHPDLHLPGPHYKYFVSKTDKINVDDWICNLTGPLRIRKATLKETKYNGIGRIIFTTNPNLTGVRCVKDILPDTKPMYQSQFYIGTCRVLIDFGKGVEPINYWIQHRIPFPDKISMNDLLSFCKSAFNAGKTRDITFDEWIAAKMQQ